MPSTIQQTSDPNPWWAPAPVLRPSLPPPPSRPLQAILSISETQRPLQAIPSISETESQSSLAAHSNEIRAAIHDAKRRDRLALKSAAPATLPTTPKKTCPAVYEIEVWREDENEQEAAAKHEKDREEEIRALRAVNTGLRTENSSLLTENTGLRAAIHKKGGKQEAGKHGNEALIREDEIRALRAENAELRAAIRKDEKQKTAKQDNEALLRGEVRAARTEANDLRTENNAFRTENTSLRTETTSLRALIRQKDELIEGLVSEQEAVIIRCDSEIKKCNSEIKKYSGDAALKDRILADRNATVKEQAALLDKKEKALKETKEVSRLRTERLHDTETTLQEKIKLLKVTRWTPEMRRAEITSLCKSLEQRNTLLVEKVKDMRKMEEELGAARGTLKRQRGVIDELEAALKRR